MICENCKTRMEPCRALNNRNEFIITHYFCSVCKNDWRNGSDFRKQITLTKLSAGIILIAGTLSALGTIKLWMPVVWADEFQPVAEQAEKNAEAIKKQDEKYNKTVKGVDAQFKILRLERKADRLERKSELTPEEQEILTEYLEDIETLEEQLSE